jgi:hypothetical protein
LLQEKLLRSAMDPDSLEDKNLILDLKYATYGSAPTGPKCTSLHANRRLRTKKQTSFKLKKNFRDSVTAGAWKNPVFHMF